MTREELIAKVTEWDNKHDGTTAQQVAESPYKTIMDQLEYHANHEWRLYLPAEHPDFNPSYLERLAAWIGNVADEADQKTLLEYALYISFFSHHDFIALFRTALTREIIPWVMAKMGIGLNTHRLEELQSRIQTEVEQHTWFCPVTDSLDINEFYKTNHIRTPSHRPTFYTLQEFGDEEKVRVYMQKHELRRLVLLEDIVGSGKQCHDVIQWALTNLETDVLFVPLLLCPNGADLLRATELESNGRLTIRPVIELLRNDLLGPEREKRGELPTISKNSNNETWPRELKDRIEMLAVDHHPQLYFNQREPFGYKNTGCSVVTFSNTPNNTLPIVHNNPPSGYWYPLFPRIARD